MMKFEPRQMIFGCATVAIVLASLVGLDVVCGLFEAQLSNNNGRNVTSILRRPDRAFDGWRFRPHPHMLYVNVANFSTNGVKQHNSMGYRSSRDFQQEPEPGVFRILTLGGSTTYGEMLERPDQAWPAQLEALLNQRGKRVEVINAGTPGASSAELLAHYLFRDRHMKPRLVLIHEAGNDVGPMMLDEYRPDYANFRDGWFDVMAPRPGEELLLRSSLMRIFYSYWLRNIDLTTLLHQAPVTQGRTPAQVLHSVEVNPVTGYARNLEMLIDLVRHDGAEPVLVEYLIASAEAFKLPRSNSRLEPYYPAVQLGVQKLNKEMAAVAGRKKVKMIRVPPDSVPLEYFFDHCHLQEKGEAIKAGLIAAGIGSSVPDKK